MYRLDPTVLDDARRIEGLTSDEQLGHRIGKTGATVRNLRKGRTTPSVEVLMRLLKITGRPMENMILREEGLAAA